MKLRIRGNSVRLRLTMNEVAEFAEKGLVENQTEFGNGQNFVYKLRMSDLVENLQTNFDNGCIQIIVPKAAADIWTQTDDVAINGSDKTVKITIEKDFACLTVRDNSDESDAYPHPLKSEL